MKRILFLYYSHRGHTEKMILAAAEGALEAGTEAIVKKTPDAVREDLVNWRCRYPGYLHFLILPVDFNPSSDIFVEPHGLILSLWPK